MSSEGYAIALPDGACTSYWDKMGCVWTIGFGSTGKDVIRTTRWTRAQAADRLQLNWQQAKAGVLRASPVLASPENVNRLDAITDFAYNEGTGRYQGSSLRVYVNRRSWSQAAAEFPKWNLAGGKVRAGLVARRQAERALFLTPAESLQTVPVAPIAGQVPDFYQVLPGQSPAINPGQQPIDAARTLALLREFLRRLLA